MRMLTLAMLLASAAPIPAYAQFNGHGGRDRGQEGASQPVDEARAARHERRAEAQAERRQEQSQAAPDAGRQARWGNGNWRGGQPVQPQTPASPQPQANPGQQGGNRHWQGRNDVMTTNPPQVRDEPRHEGRRDGDRNAGRDWNNRQGGVQGQYPVPQNGQRHWNGDRDNDRAGNQGGWHRQDNGRWERRGDRDRDHDRDGRNWNNGSQYRDWNRTWRNDGRYDWQRYRNQYRNHYRAPRYDNPYGYNYGYRRFGIGIYLDSLFFSNRYWLSDPWEYRLPAAPYGCRWVRYYDDVLLVDTRSGYVVDVIYDFFW